MLTTLPGLAILAATFGAFPLVLERAGAPGALALLAMGVMSGAGLLVSGSAATRRSPTAREAVAEVGRVLRALPVFFFLLAIRTAARLLYRFDVEWVGRPGRDPYRDLRMIALLNHTSLYEPLYAALFPLRMLWAVALGGVVPIASKTMDRPGAGLVLRLVSGRVVSVTRRRDGTWDEVLRHACDPRSIALICPEGRMLRPNGLDSEGKPMTVRGGIADLLAEMPGGRMFVIYSGGLHHVAAPGDRVPRFFRRIPVRLEVLDVAAYRTALGGAHDPDEFRRRVVQDLTVRRNRHCPVDGTCAPRWAA